MTLDGTNTWILREPGASRSVVVDPGPPDAAHLDRVLEAAGDVGLVLFTHRHFDHTESMQVFASRTGAPARAIDPEFCLDADPLVDGETIDVDGLRLDVAGDARSHGRLHLLPAARRAVVAHRRHRARPRHDDHRPPRRRARPVPRLARPAARAGGGGPRRPHPPRPRPRDRPGRARCSTSTWSTARNASTRCSAALDAGATDARSVVERVYTDVDESLWPAAELSVQAQLDYLQGT